MNSDRVLVQVTDALESFMGIDGSVMPETKRGDVISVPRANAEALVERGAVTILNPPPAEMLVPSRINLTPTKADDNGGDLALSGAANVYLYKDSKGKTNIDFAGVASWVKKRFHGISFGGSLWIYADGIYRRNQGEVEACIKDLFDSIEWERPLGFIIREIMTQVIVSEPCRAWSFNQHKDTVPVRNGVLLLDPVVGSIALLPHSPEYRFTYQLPIDYDPDAPTEPVLSVLRQWVAPEDVDVLVQYPAQCILQAQGLIFKKAYLLEGQHDAAKTTYTRLIQRLLGANLIGDVDLRALCEDRFALATLESKIGNIYDDLAAFPLRYIGRFNKITGGNRHRIERKGKDGYETGITAAHLFTCNVPPKVNENNDLAFWSRWEYVVFPFQFTRDPGFENRTFTDAFLSGFLNLVLKAIMKIQKSGTLLRESSADDIQDAWLRSADPLRAFLADHTIRAAETSIRTEEFYQGYVGYCKEKSHKVQPKNRVSALLGIEGIHVSQPNIDTKRVRVYTGIGWKDDSLYRTGVPS